MHRASLVLVTCLTLLAAAAPAVAAPPDNPAGLQRVIVQLRPDGPSPRGLSAELAEASGGRTGAVYEHALKGFAAELPEAAIDALRRNPNVLSITPDRIISIAGQDIPTGFDRIEADLAPPAPTSTTSCPAGETCTDVDIAVLDTGSNNHPDLNVVDRVDCSALFGPCVEGTGYDGHGHGTHVAGIAAAYDNTDGVIGVAPGARVWSVKVLDDTGNGFLTSLIAGIDWVTGRAGVIDVVNMSLSGIFSDTNFNTAISNSVGAGVTYVVAAGNAGEDAVNTSPANHPEVITVSAVADGDGAGGHLGAFLCRDGEADDTLATFSNFGPSVDIAAPGVCIRSTWYNGGYETRSGTSMASPYVAGAAARYLAVNGRDTNGDGSVNGLDVARLKDDLIAGGIPQSDSAGFTGDADSVAEPLLFLNGTAFQGNGDLTVADPDTSAPPAPTLTALADGYTVDLAWSQVEDPESGVLSYQVWRDTALIAEVDHATFSLQDRGDPDTTYSYEVSAVNRQGGEGLGSSPVSAATSADDPADAGWWALNDGTGSLAADDSAWRRPGTLANGPAWEATGAFGGALRFDGNNDRLDLDPAILNGFGDITAAMWLKTTKTGQQALISGANAGNSNEYLIFLADASTLRLYTGGSASAGLSWNLPFSIADDAWHHLAVVRNDTLDRAAAYLDGTPLTLWGVGMTTVDIEPEGLVFGQDQDSVGGGFQSSQAFLGSLDDLSVYTRVLTDAEIAELADADTSPPTGPGSLTATADGLRIDLAWPAADDPESGIAGYEIWRGTASGGAKTLLAEVPGTQTSYPDARTAPSTHYFYEVLAVNGVGLAGPASPGATDVTGPGTGDPDLVGWWALDDGSGTVAVDSSDYGLDGALVPPGGEPVWDPAGQIAGALTFDGNNWVDLDSQILDGATDVTVALWVKTTKTGIQAFVSGANAGNDAEFELVPISDTVVRFYTGETNESHVLWTVPAFADGTWHHFAVTRDAGNDQATLYLDGVSQGPLGAIFDEINIDPGGLVLAQEQDSVGNDFDPAQAFLGSLDEVRLYRRLLSASEIAVLAGLAAPDTQPPVITLLGSSSVTVEGGDAYVEPGAVALDDVDGDISADVVIDASAVDTSTPGTYVVTYDVSDAAGNAAVQVIRTVEVVDTTAPVITLVGDDPQMVEGGDPYSEQGATASDIVDGDLSTVIVIDSSAVDISTPGLYLVTYDVSDAAGNAALRVTRTVEVVDTTAPVITLVGDDPFFVEVDSVYEDPGATASDIVDGDLSAGVVIDSSLVDTSTVGTYVVTYDVSDTAGNPAVQVTRTVQVVEMGHTVVYVSSTSGGTVGGVSFADEDILAYDTVTDTWSTYLDGSDVGLNGSEARDIDAFELLVDGSVLLSFVASTTIPDLGSVDDSDIVRFVPASLGTSTAGNFEWYFDGSDVGLTSSGEDVDAITLLADGRIVVSTVGSFGVAGASGRDEDLVVFTPTSLGSSTSGTWALYFDGSDVALNNTSSEDVNGVWVDVGTGEVYLTTVGSFSVTGVSGSGSDILTCTATSLGSSTACTFAMFWDGSGYGFGSEVVDGISVGS